MILVTGGAGFIGSNIVRGLNNLGLTDIIIVDNLKNSIKHRNLNRIKFKDYIDKNDFDSENFLNKNKADIVFHQGACSSTTESDGHYMMKNNYEFTKNLYSSCIKNNIRFIYASSASVYGNGEQGFIEKPECEYPLNVYAFSKYQFDRYVLSEPYIFSSSSNYPQIVGLRYFNVYGPQENHKGSMASVAFHLFNQIKKGENMKLFEGSGNFKRDFIHVDDVVAVNMFCYANEKISGIFNCGTGKAESFLTIAETFADIYKEAKIDLIPFPEHLKGKYQTFTQADLTKLRKAGYTEKFMSLSEGTRKYIETLEKSGGYLM